jgi:indolepyruvate ferredoxin oxidoreductase
MDFGLLARRVAAKLGDDRVAYLDATGLATALMGDAVFGNFLLVGAALQLGWLPVGRTALERALELNGVSVQGNLRALNLGRLWVHDAAGLQRALGAAAPSPEDAPATTLEQTIAAAVERLTAYQNAAYAQRYLALVQAAREAERRAAGSEGAFSAAVARGFARLMAYKDEYEVARLYALPEFRRQIEAQFEGVRGLRFHLAPPLWASKPDPDTGRPRKRSYGAWVLSAFGWLARLRGLRGSAFDPFGHTEERRAERRLVDDYEARIRRLIAELDTPRLALATQAAEVAEQVRGYGPVKARQMEGAEARWRELDAAWTAAHHAPPAALIRRAAG